MSAARQRFSSVPPPLLAATVLAVVWVAVAATGWPWPSAGASEHALLTERRVVALVPPLLGCVVAGRMAGNRRSSWLALAWAGFAVAWAAWGVVARMCHGNGDLLTGLQAAWHEPVALPALAMAAIGWARAGAEHDDPRAGGIHAS